jgi:uncharacterized protein YprB with RNaseH-like and TPR domain
MTVINPNTLTKQQQKIWYNESCKHYHKYCNHPACFKRDILQKGGDLKEGYLDIETTGFEANFHHILTYVIKVKGEKKYYIGTITKQDLESGEFDKRVCKQLVEDLAKFDIIYTYYGSAFDIRFMRSRCMYWNIVFPEFGTLQHKDLYYVTRRLLKLNRHSLESATRFLGIEGKNHVLGKEWMLARVGDKKALKYVMEHNILDCDILEKLHDKLENYFKRVFSTV